MKQLERSLGLVSVVAISISAMLGSGIFVLPGLAAAKTGSSVWLAYILAGLIVLPAALSKAELATAMPASGGTYIYLDRIFGPLFGTIAGLAVWASMWLKSAFALLGFGAYLQVLVHLGEGAEADKTLRNVALTLLIGVVALNVLGVKKVGKAQVAVVGTALVCLTGLCIVGFIQHETPTSEPFLSDGVPGLFGAAGFVFVSYNGVTKVAAIAEEVDKPERNLPLGILISLILAIVLYALVASVLVGNIPMDRLVHDLHPVYTLADEVGGGMRWPGIIAAILGVVTMTSMANAGMLAASRYPFAMSRDRLLPPILHRIDPRFKTPIPAILITAAVMAFAIKLLDVEKLAKLASVAVICIFIAEQAAVVAFRESRAGWYRPRFRSPLYPAPQVIGILGGLVLLFMLGRLVPVAIAGAVIPGTLLFLLYGRKRTERMGVVGKLAKRGDLVRPSGRIGTTQQPPATLGGEAAVVVTLFGKERSPEMLIDMGAALADGRKLHATHVSEVEEQVQLSGLLDEDIVVQSLRRRISAMAEERHLDLEFHAIVSRDLVRTVHAVTSRVQCQWLVMQWHGRPRQSLTSLTPIGWLINHLEVNLAMFRDVGVRYVRRILALPAPGPHDALVVRTADDLAETWGAQLVLGRYVADDVTEVGVTAVRDYLGQLNRLCDAPCEHLVIRGPKKLRAMEEATAAFDLVVLGAPDLSWRNLVRRSIEDKIIASAACSVLVLKTPRGLTHEAFSRRRPASEQPWRLDEFLTEATVAARLEVGTKTALFNELAQRFADAFDDGVDVKTLHDAFNEREREQNTGVGQGVALPHGTVTAANRSLLGVFTSNKPVAYGASDDRPVDVFFATVCPPSERETHLRLLSHIAKLTIKTDVLKRLRHAKSADEIRDAIIECSSLLEQ